MKKKPYVEVNDYVMNGWKTRIVVLGYGHIVPYLEYRTRLQAVKAAKRIAKILNIEYRESK